MTEKLLDLTTVLERTGVSKSTIYAMIRQGEFPAQKQIGARRVAWSEREVMRWLEERGVIAAPELDPKPRGLGPISEKGIDRVRSKLPRQKKAPR